MHLNVYCLCLLFSDLHNFLYLIPQWLYLIWCLLLLHIYTRLFQNVFNLNLRSFTRILWHIVGSLYITTRPDRWNWMIKLGDRLIDLGIVSISILTQSNQVLKLFPSFILSIQDVVIASSWIRSSNFLLLELRLRLKHVLWWIYSWESILLW